MTTKDAGKKRWEGKSKEERSEHARLMNEAKYFRMPESERKAIGKKLAAAKKLKAKKTGTKKRATKKAGRKKPR